MPASRETASDILRQSKRGLQSFFAPRAVAVIGATEDPDGAGNLIVRNLIASPFGGMVFPVSRECSQVQGIRAYDTIGEVPDRVDLAVIATPADQIPDVITECGTAGVEAAIIVSAGFRETAADSAIQSPVLLERARSARMRILGPASLGVMCTATGLNATCAPAMALRGTVGFISQSNALSTAVLDWSLGDLVGFSTFISVGNMIDVGWGDLIDYLGNDPNTRSIVIYMESIGDARSFLSAAREVALSKPIIVIKTGRSPEGAEASQSHTGAWSGSDEVLDAAFRRCGVLRVEKVADLFYMAEVLARQPRPRGPRLAIVSNAGGPGVIATDAAVQYGSKIASLSEQTVAEMDKVMPALWSRSNPVDILGDADPDRYADAVKLVGSDENTDGLVVILTKQALTDPTQTAEKLRPYAKLQGKPILASWMGGADVAAGLTILNQAGIPTYPYADSAARAFSYMWQYTYNLHGIYETPAIAPDIARAADREMAAEVIQVARGMKRTLLTWSEAERLLAAYGIPTVENLVATDEDQAVRYARAVGYPVVMKAIRQAVTQETGLRGAQLNLLNSDAVRKAFRTVRDAVAATAGERGFLGVSIQRMVKRAGYEVVLSSRIDPQFGPVLVFGASGRLGRALKDQALALPPLTMTLARRMLEQTRVYAAFLGEHGDEPVDLTALQTLIVRFSYLVVEQRWIEEIRIDPLLVSADGALALGARVTLLDPAVTEDQLPRLSIRPYPIQYVSEWTMRDGTQVLIRPIRPEDEPLIVDFHQTLSDQSIYMRYFHAMKLSQRVAHERMVRICFNDYDREIALVAENVEPETGKKRILGVSRLSKIHGTDESEFSLLVNDSYHGNGLGTELLRRLIQVARDERLSCILADILPENYPMQHVCEKLGFKLTRDTREEVVKARIDL
ncbi:MAG: GNAT family N-acetyltransferase [Chthonomonadales bacterium]|nr:GNAT family N-acetyltransferase [Chthonomonadales bacterium]